MDLYMAQSSVSRPSSLIMFLYVGLTHKSVLACGSMVLYFFCRSFLPGGAKKTYKGSEIRGLRKSYTKEKICEMCTPYLKEIFNAVEIEPVVIEPVVDAADLGAQEAHLEHRAQHRCAD